MLISRCRQLGQRPLRLHRFTRADCQGQGHVVAREGRLGAGRRRQAAAPSAISGSAKRRRVTGPHVMMIACSAGRTSFAELSQMGASSRAAVRPLQVRRRRRRGFGGSRASAVLGGGLVLHLRRLGAFPAALGFSGDAHAHAVRRNSALADVKRGDVGILQVGHVYGPQVLGH